MDFNALAEERYSVRTFDPRPIEKEKLDQVLRAGRIAPTACNNQPQRILVVNTDESMEKLKKCTPYTFGAPTALIICYDAEKAWLRPFDEDNSGTVDAAIVASHMMLQAADLGLGTTWVGYFDPGLVAGEFSFPETYVPVAILPIGYPAKDAAKNELHDKKLPEDEIVFYEDFGAEAQLP